METGCSSPEAAQDIVERQEGTAAELDDDGLLGLGQDGTAGRLGPIGASAVPVRARHFAAVFGFSP
jgi:hypothetical protein